MEVTWELPAHEFNKDRDADFVLGLVRYGAGSNSPGIVLKPVEASNSRSSSSNVWRGDGYVR